MRRLERVMTGYIEVFVLPLCTAAVEKLSWQLCDMPCISSLFPFSCNDSQLDMQALAGLASVAVAIDPSSLSVSVH